MPFGHPVLSRSPGVFLSSDEVLAHARDLLRRVAWLLLGPTDSQWFISPSNYRYAIDQGDISTIYIYNYMCVYIYICTYHELWIDPTWCSVYSSEPTWNLRRLPLSGGNIWAPKTSAASLAAATGSQAKLRGNQGVSHVSGKVLKKCPLKPNDTWLPMEYIHITLYILYIYIYYIYIQYIYDIWHMQKFEGCLTLDSSQWRWAGGGHWSGLLRFGACESSRWRKRCKIPWISPDNIWRYMVRHGDT